MEKLNEVLARAWMVCDPNRQPCDPDELNFRVGKGSEFYGQPEWKWFVPQGLMMEWLIERICKDIVSGCQKAGMVSPFWTNVEITADPHVHGASKVSLTVPLFVPLPAPPESHGE